MAFSQENKIEFYKFLIGDKSLFELESFIYKQIDLEQQLNYDTYLELISFGFKDASDVAKISSFIKEKLIDEGEFETWKLQNILKLFLADTNNLHIYLDKLYHLYCGMYQDNGERKYEYRFLGNLGLNYLYWINEGYMKLNYGDKWYQEYEKSFNDFEFYHQQLKPFAEEILKAINNREIQILSDGTYTITDDLRRKLESGNIYELKHPDRKYNS